MYFSIFSSLSINSPNKDQLGHYLAGLIEGDGSIIVPSNTRNEKRKLLYPTIKITFVIKDLPLASRLMEILGGGTIESTTGEYRNLLIQDVATLHKVAILLNGKMRTPKIEALHRLIEWFNNRDNHNMHLPKLELEISSLASNAWLAGLLDADGNFYCNFNLNNKGLACNIKYYMRVSQRQVYHRISDLTDNSYLTLMENMTNYLEVTKVNSINRTHLEYVELAYEIRTDRRVSCAILINYLSRYPLFSSKYLDYLAWEQIHNLNVSREYRTIDGTKRLQCLKASINTLRTVFNWDHLNSIYTN